MKYNILTSTLFSFFVILFSCSNESNEVSPTGNESVGTGGSLARFTISGDYLYAVDQQKLITFTIEDPMVPKTVDQFPLEWGVETIFALDTIIFVGTQTGMHMFDISEGSRPGYLSNYEHIQSCDPVVAQDTLAFVTLRSGNGCWNGINQLDVLDIRELTNPRLIKSYPMTNPHGLAVTGNHLFVCEGQYGLRTFEISEGGQLEEIGFHQNIRSIDVIIRPDNLMIVVAEDGLFQYDFTDINNLKLLSSIKKEY